MIRIIKSVFLLVCILTVSAGCSKKQEDSKAVSVPVINEVAAKTTLLAAISDQEKPQKGNQAAKHSATPAGQAQADNFQIVFNSYGKGVAYVAEKAGSVYVVYNAKAGNVYSAVEHLTISPDGLHVAYGALKDGKWLMVVDGRESTRVDSVGIPRFSPDSRHVFYDARIGEQWHLVLDDHTSAMLPLHYDYYDKFFTDDSQSVVSIENPLENNGPVRLVVTDLSFKKRYEKALKGTNIDYNKNRSRLTMITDSNGKKRVIDVSIMSPNDVKEGPLYDAIIHNSYGADGRTVTYVAERDGKRYLVLNDKEDSLPDGILRDPPVIRPDLKEAGIIIDREEGGAYLHHAFINPARKQNTYQEAASLIYNKQTNQHAYIAKQGKKVFMVVDDKEGPAFDMVVTPMFSPDGSRLIYRARKNGKRFVVVADSSGTVLRQHPEYEQVFETVFTGDGKSVAYGVKDGRKLVWKVEGL
jgi:WD40 repeat protein